MNHYNNQSDLWLGQTKSPKSRILCLDGNMVFTIYGRFLKEILSRFLYHKCYFEDNTMIENSRLLL